MWPSRWLRGAEGAYEVGCWRCLVRVLVLVENALGRYRYVAGPSPNLCAPARPCPAAFRPFNDTTGEMFPHSYVFSYNYFYPWWVDLGGGCKQ